MNVFIFIFLFICLFLLFAFTCCCFLYFCILFWFVLFTFILFYFFSFFGFVSIVGKVLIFNIFSFHFFRIISLDLIINLNCQFRLSFSTWNYHGIKFFLCYVLVYGNNKQTEYAYSGSCENADFSLSGRTWEGWAIFDF